MSAPTLYPCPGCRRHVDPAAPCPFCGAAALGRGFGQPDAATPRAEATLYGLPPVDPSQIRLPDGPQPLRQLPDAPVPMPAYGMPPIGGSAAGWAWPLLLVFAVLLAGALLFFLLWVR